jgi:hypothetical protein
MLARLLKPLAVIVLPAISLMATAQVLQSIKSPTQPGKVAPVQAKEKPAAPAPPKKVEFLRDIAPILDRGQCSTAECHGKFGGRGGFQLSLLTLSPEDDYDPIVHGGRGRRIDFSDPPNSLFLLKATGAAPHAGGMRFEVGSPYYKTILNWIKQGATFDDKDPRLVTLKVSPEKSAFKKVGQVQPIKVTATYTDGSERDVTAQSVFMSTNSAVLSVTPK